MTSDSSANPISCGRGWALTGLLSHSGECHRPVPGLDVAMPRATRSPTPGVVVPLRGRSE